jgi:hypothetical protein
MSEPKRYAIRGFSAALVEEENGVFVRYDDYARLKAEVERLTKAGDAMKFDCLDYLRELEKRPFWFPLLSELEVNHKSVQAWNAAKEGKQP